MTRSLSEAVAGTTPVEASVTLWLDGGLHDRGRALTTELTAALSARDVNRAVAAAKAVEALRDSSPPVEFTFRQVDAERFTVLCDAAPPKEGDERAFDETKLWPALVRESMADPAPDDGFDTWWTALNWSRRHELFACAWRVNAEPVEAPFVPAASAITQLLRATSTTAGRGESPGRSSAAGVAKRSRRASTTKRGG